MRLNQMHINIGVSPATEAGRYLITCARIRNITVTSLINRLVDRIGTDQLVQAVLDDDGQRQAEIVTTNHEKKFREPTSRPAPTLSR